MSIPANNRATRNKTQLPRTTKPPIDDSDSDRDDDIDPTIPTTKVRGALYWPSTKGIMKMAEKVERKRLGILDTVEFLKSSQKLFKT
jgi:hypothetical protein